MIEFRAHGAGSMARPAWLRPAVVLSTILLFSLSCGQLSEPPEVLVEVGDFALDEADLDEYEARLPEHLGSPLSGAAQIRDVLSGLVDRQLMIMEARRLGYFEVVEVERKLRRSTRRWLADHQIKTTIGDSVTISAAEEEAAYRNGWSRKVRLAHIELANKADAEAAGDLLAAGADFAAVARSRSIAPDAADGGDLPRWYGPDDLPPQLATAVASMAVGDISGIIPTGRGFEIVRVVAADSVTLEEVRQPLRRSLQQRVLQRARRQLLIELEARFDVRYDGEVIARVQEHASSQDSQSSQPLAARGRDVLLRAGNGLRLLRSGALGREAIADSAGFVGAVRERILADSLLVWEAHRRGLDGDPAFARFHQRRHEDLAITHLRRKQVIEHIVITDEDVRQRYEQDIDDYSEQPVSEVVEIATDSLGLARHLLQRVRAGEDMAELSRQYGRRRSTHAHRHVTEAPGADEDAASAQLREAVHGREIGSLIGPLQLAGGGYLIARVEGRAGVWVRSLESVRPVLEYKLKRERNAQEFERYIQALRQQYGGEVTWHDQSIDELAKRRR